MVDFAVRIYALAGSIAITIALASCSHVSWERGDERAERWAFGVNVDAQTLEIEATPEGGRSVRAEGLRSDSAEAVEAATRGAVDAVLKAIKAGAPAP